MAGDVGSDISVPKFALASVLLMACPSVGLFFVLSRERASSPPRTTRGRSKPPHPLVLKSIASAGPTIPGHNLRTLCCDNHRSHEPRGIWRELLAAAHFTPSANGLFLDIGTSFDMSDGAEALKLNYSVVAIEGRPRALATVKKTFTRSLGTGALSVLNAAVSERGGGATQIMDADDSSSSVRSAVEGDKYTERLFERGGKRLVQVRTVSIDEIVGDRPCAVVKLDIQGGEFEALLGALRVLSRPMERAPIVVFELYERFRPDLPDLDPLHLLRAKGYICYDVSSRQPASASGRPLPVGPRPLRTDFACRKAGPEL